MSNLKQKFKRWWKGIDKIIKLEQGDDNLIAVIFLNRYMSHYSVGVYKYTDGEFHMIKVTKSTKSKAIALNKFRKIVREF